LPPGSLRRLDRPGRGSGSARASSAAQGLDLAAEPLVLLGEMPLCGFGFVGAATRLVAPFLPCQQALSGRGVEETKPLAIALEV